MTKFLFDMRPKLYMMLSYIFETSVRIKVMDFVVFILMFGLAALCAYKISRKYGDYAVEKYNAKPSIAGCDEALGSFDYSLFSDWIVGKAVGIISFAIVLALLWLGYLAL